MIGLILILAVVSLDDLAITVPEGTSRQYIYTNKEAGFYSGETSGENTSSYNGWFVRLHKYLEDYEIQLGTDLLDRSAAEVAVYPDRLVRHHELHNTRETVTLLDSVDALVVDVETDWRGAVSLVPKVSFRYLWEVKKPQYDVVWEDVLLVSRRDWRGDEFPLYLGISTDHLARFEDSPVHASKTYPKDLRRRAMVTDFPFSPGKLEWNTENGRFRLVFALGGSPEEVKETIGRVRADVEALKTKRSSRMENLLAGCDLKTSDDEYEKALKWAILSLDGLIFNHPFRGIYAGFFWFPTFWGRDTFISLPGACIVLGRFELAKEIIHAFSEHQKEQGKEKGRLPNLVIPGQMYYNTTDGTHWFIREVWQLVRYSGDVAFVEEIFPVIERAIEGALEERTDESGFLLHGEAETWMDAGGEQNPHSPRGNRAVEVEALWYNSLVAGADLASLLGKTKTAERWSRLSVEVRSAFREKFWDPETKSLFDHINADGSPDARKRPNQVFAVTVPIAPLLTSDEERMIMEFAETYLIEPHGVLSLSKYEPDFHPYHIDWDAYHFDDAYHNGDVWLWLAGPMVDLMVKQGNLKGAWALTSHLTEVLLEKGAVGTLPELENGVFLAEEENLEGTISQTWSLAEYVRTFYQSYLGVRPDALTKRIVYKPALPEGLDRVQFRFRVGNSTIEAEYDERGDEPTYSFVSRDLESPYTLEVQVSVPDGELLQFSGELTAGERLTVSVRREGDEWTLVPSRHPTK